MTQTARLLVLIACAAFAGPVHGASSRAADQKALEHYLGGRSRSATAPPPEFPGEDTYQVGWTDLNGDGRPDAVVRWNGRRYCGSGGCGMEILERTSTGFRFRGAMTITQLPVEVLSSRTRGWRDISVLVAGGGILPGYRARLDFDGRRYPSNPSVPSGRRLPAGAHGKILIDEATPELKID